MCIGTMLLLVKTASITEKDELSGHAQTKSWACLTTDIQ